MEPSAIEKYLLCKYEIWLCAIANQMSQTSPTFCCQILQIFDEKLNFFSDAPQLWLSLGQNLAEDKIKEGDDVYFECSVDAKPTIYKTSWWFNVSWNLCNLHMHVELKMFEINLAAGCIYTLAFLKA